MEVGFLCVHDAFSSSTILTPAFGTPKFQRAVLPRVGEEKLFQGLYIGFEISPRLF